MSGWIQATMQQNTIVAFSQCINFNILDTNFPNIKSYFNLAKYNKILSMTSSSLQKKLMCIATP